MQTTRFSEPRIENLEPKRLVGKHLTMSLADNKTGLLWKSFMERRRDIVNAVGSDLISMQVYPESHDFNRFNFEASFEKWATAEVSGFDEVPEGMETFELQGGLYAVFFYKGDLSGAPAMFRHIFGSWLPASGYELDQRPHFELLGPKYKNNDPESEEEIWIPLKPKS